MVFSFPLKVASGVLAVAGASAGAYLLSSGSSPTTPKSDDSSVAPAVDPSSVKVTPADPTPVRVENQNSGKPSQPQQTSAKPVTQGSNGLSDRELSARRARFSHWPSHKPGSFASRSNASTSGETFTKRYPNINLITTSASDSAWNKKIEEFKKKFNDKESVYSTFDVSGDARQYYGDVLNRYTPLSSGWVGEDYRYFLYNWCNDNKESRDTKVHELLKTWCVKG